MTDVQFQGGLDMVQSPRLIIEVLSESTEAYDRGKKFALYRQCPTIEEYVLIATDHQAVEVFHRTPEGWAGVPR
jgi:Uma2 family endonuclease